MHLNEDFYAPTLQISSSALKHNLELIRGLIKQPKVKVLLPVKANAYGCGLTTLLPFIKSINIDMLGVANFFEAIQIRKGGFKKGILLLGSFYKENVNLFFQEDVTPVIADIWQIKFLEEECQKRKKKLDIHVKWDMGMGRLGICPDQKELFLSVFSKTSFLRIRGLMTHFPRTDRKSSLEQLKKFINLSKLLIRRASLNRENVILHSANSYAILNYSESALDMIRPGIFFYGYFQTFKDYKKLHYKFPIRPCLKLTSKPFLQRFLKKGDKISYAATYQVKKNNYPVGILPIGYADGIPISLSNKVSFSGFPLLGRVTMDQIILGGITRLDQMIEILGENSPPLEYWGYLSKTITYEIMTGLGHRLMKKLI